MKPVGIVLSLLVLATTAMAADAPSFDDVMKKATADYAVRLKQAAEELNATRTRIAEEKAPLLRELRQAEDRIIGLEAETRKLENRQAEAAETRRQASKQLEERRRTAHYIATLVQDGLKALNQSMPAEETQLAGGRLADLQPKLDESIATAAITTEPALDAAEFLLARTERSLGGYLVDGESIMEGSNEVVKGTFAFMGPATFFRAQDGHAAGLTVTGAQATFPMTHPLVGWPADEATALFAGKTGTILADVSGGKALRLKAVQGTVWSHIRTGGVVAYAILGVGALAVLLMAQKLWDLRRMRLDRPTAVRTLLAAVARGDRPAANQQLAKMSGTTRELFDAGFAHWGAPREVMEEHLQAVLLYQQLQFERRLPLLAVIATASPLLGLLGTVVGMVKTFALITVFGTGNAGKLASGISQVLVATELGLIVAIPTLVVHGFLAHRIHKNLALLEQYAVQFLAAAAPAAVGKASPVAAERP